MSYFDDRFEQHQAHKSLAATLNAHDKLATDDREIESDLIDYVAASEVVLKNISRFLRSVDPQLVPVNLLDETQTHSNDVRTRIEQFIANGDRNQITGMVAVIDALNRVSASLSGIAASSSSEDGIQDAASSYRRSAGQHVANLSKQAKEYRDDLAALKTKLNELDKSVTDQKSRVDSVISEHQEQFSQAQQDRLNKWQEERDQFDEAFKTQITTANEATTVAVDGIGERGGEVLKAIRQDSKAALDELQQRRTEARALIEATAVDAIAADFKSAAGNDKNAADKWRFYAISIMLLGIGVVVWLLILAPKGEIDLIDVGRATLVAATLAAPALYAQRESNKHRIAARQNERFALELNALEPFLANFDDPESIKAIKKDFADRVFGSRESSELIDELEVTQSGLIELLKMLAKKL